MVLARSWALIPVVTYLGPIAAAILTGTFVVEYIFGIPGEENLDMMDAILDYIGWVKSMENAGNSPSASRYTQILTDFLIYVIHKGTAWEKMFTLKRALPGKP